MNEGASGFAPTPVVAAEPANKGFVNPQAKGDQGGEQKKLPTFLEPNNEGAAVAKEAPGVRPPQGFIQHGMQPPQQDQVGQGQPVSGLGQPGAAGLEQGGMVGGVGGIGAGSSSVYDNLVYSNLMLGNWLGTIKSNNNSLFENMNGMSLGDQINHKSNLERYLQAEQQQKMLEMGRGMPMQTEEQQSIISLMQQIGLYKELLSQVSYQNQLLSRDISARQPNASLKFPSQLDQTQPQQQGQFGGGMQGVGNFMSMGMQGVPGMGGMSGMGGMNPMMANPALMGQMGRDMTGGMAAMGQLAPQMGMAGGSEQQEGGMTGQPIDMSSLAMMAGGGMNPMVNPMGMNGMNPMGFGMGGQNMGNMSSMEMLRSQMMEQMKKDSEKKNEDK